MDRTTEIARSALVTYHFVAIMLHENLSKRHDGGPGSAYASGHMVTSQRAQEAFELLTSTKPVGRDGVSPCPGDCRSVPGPEDRGIIAAVATPKPGFKGPSPLYVSYTGFPRSRHTLDVHDRSISGPSDVQTATFHKQIDEYWDVTTEGTRTQDKISLLAIAAKLIRLRTSSR